MYIQVANKTHLQMCAKHVCLKDIFVETILRFYDFILLRFLTFFEKN